MTPRTLRLEDDGTIPNSDLPLLLYERALDPTAGDLAAAFERRFAANGWTGSWRNGIYPYHHYHSTTHEVLGIAHGAATVQLGGEGGPIVEVRAGDVVVIPAGVGHKRVSASSDLLVVGAYPDGRAWDLCRGGNGERARALVNLAAVPLPACDPLHGPDGPLSRLWREARTCS